MAHTLPALPYAFDALEPHIDAQTMEIHSQRHHKAYVDNLNKALAGHADLEAKDITALLRDIKSVPEAIRPAVINNGGGHANHSLFWEIMTPNGGGDPTGAIGEAIVANHGDFAKFKDVVKQNALTQFGSGWSWLVWDAAAGALKAVKKPNQDSPLMEGQVPLLGIDVWEHAYYLKYQNKRPDYLAAWWNTVNWDAINKRLAIAKK
jgi:Fe-Mn family superoxide dismutase